MSADNGARLLDLDAERATRAARAEAEGSAPVVMFGGEKFQLPPEPPWEVAEKGAAGDPTGAVRALLGDQYAAFVAHRPSLFDVQALVDGAMRLYGFADAGESPASDSSSWSGSRR